MNYPILRDIYKTVFTNYNNCDFKFSDNLNYENMLRTAFNLVHFGWKKEAIPVSQPIKSRLARFFDAIFS